MTDAKAAAQRFSEKVLTCAKFINVSRSLWCDSGVRVLPLCCSCKVRPSVAAAVEPLMDALLECETAYNRRIINKALAPYTLEPEG